MRDINRVDDGSIGPRSAHAQEITPDRRRSPLLFRRAPNRLAQRDSRQLPRRNQPRRSRDVPRNAQFLREDIRRSRGQHCQRCVGARNPVDHLIDGSIAAANNHHLAAVLHRITRQFRRGTGASGWQRMRVDSRSLQDPRRFLNRVQPPRTLAPTRRIVNNHRVVNLLW